MELAFFLLLLVILSIPVFLLRRKFPEHLASQIGIVEIEKKLQRYSTLAILLFSLAMVMAIFGRVAATKWNMIDDHEIMLFLGPDGKLPVGEMFSAFSQTEVGNFGSLERFRPSYYFLRILETVLWGANPWLWHLARLAFLWLSICLTWLLVLPRLGWIGGGVFCAYLLTFAFWVDTIGRLGAGETYAVIGLPLFLWGLTVAFHKNIKVRMQIFSGASILLGSILCIGSKENFLLLVIPLLVVFVRSFRNGNYYILFFTSISLLFAVFVGAAVYLLISRTGGDVYSNSVSPLVRLQNLIGAILKGNNLLDVLLLISIIFLAGIAGFVLRTSENRSDAFRQAFSWFVILLALYLSQLIFYNGIWPVGSRYDFPGILYLPAAIYILYILAERIFAQDSVTLLPAYLVRGIFVAALGLMVWGKGYKNIIVLLDGVVTNSLQFTSNLSEISSVLKQSPESVLVLESRNVYEYEPIFSYQRFLNANGVTNPLFLRIHCYSPETVPAGQAKKLALKLNEISIQGDDNFLPLSRLVEYEDRCYSLNLSSPTLTECSKIDTKIMDCK